MAKDEPKKAFLALVTQHQGIIHKVCSIYCDNGTDRQDLFQEVLLQVWKSYPSFKGQSKVSTWLYRVALNTAISMFRKKSRRPKEQSLGFTEFQLADTPPNFEYEERQRYLHKAIEKLNKIERAIIMLYLEDHSYHEISEIMGISETNVGVKLHRIKTKLKRIVQKQRAYDGVG